jgi:hypothetical protein
MPLYTAVIQQPSSADATDLQQTVLNLRAQDECKQFDKSPGMHHLVAACLVAGICRDCVPWRNRSSLQRRLLHAQDHLARLRRPARQ